MSALEDLIAGRHVDASQHGELRQELRVGRWLDGAPLSSLGAGAEEDVRSAIVGVMNDLPKVVDLRNELKDVLQILSSRTQERASQYVEGYTDDPYQAGARAGYARALGEISSVLLRARLAAALWDQAEEPGTDD